MEEIGLFPLGMVLLPTERVPLHIFEPRYRELIGECIREEREFGLLYGDDDGLREVGTRTSVLEVLERFENGRLSIAVEGRERFRVVELTEGRSFATARIEPVQDEEDLAGSAEIERAIDRYRNLGLIVEAEIEEPDPTSPQLSFELAARVDFGVERKQELLELRSEAERLRQVSALLERAAEAITLEQELQNRAATNGRGISRTD